MNISNNGINLIKDFEGYNEYVYKDSVGTKTVGWGHTGKDVDVMHLSDKITQKQAEEFLHNDIARAEYQVNKYDRYSFNQNQFDALVSFAFNIGSIDQLTNNGTRTCAEISAKIPAYCNAGGVKLEGLVNRRAAEKKLFDKEVEKDGKDV